MRIITIYFTIGCASLTAACVARPVVVTPSIPTPVPSATEPASQRPSTLKPTLEQARQLTWQFAYTPGTYVYKINTSASVAVDSNSLTKRALPPASQRIAVTLLTGGAVTVVEPTSQTAGAESCNANAAIVTRASFMIQKIPQQLTAGFTWVDSVETNGCRGSIPLTSKTVRQYTVIGDTTYEGKSTLLITRTDSITAKGEGCEGQHRILITAAGNGTAQLYFDIPAGQFLGSTSSQIMLLDVITSGRLTHFIQHTNERVTLE